MDESGRAGQPVCPNCGLELWDQKPGVPCSGDRLLVQKYLFDLRAPRRWEAVVFQNPADPSQAYVKRVVGLPNESVLIRGGDIYIDGTIARKTLAEQRALRVLVYDNDHLPDDHGRFPRWRFRRGGVAILEAIERLGARRSPAHPPARSPTRRGELIGPNTATGRRTGAITVRCVTTFPTTVWSKLARTRWLT